MKPKKINLQKLKTIKVRIPSFATDRRVKFREEFLKRGSICNDIESKMLAESELSPIDIVSKRNRRDTNLSWGGIAYKNFNVVNKRAKITVGGIIGEIAFDAVDKETKTILIRVHLDQQEEAIIQDMRYLLDLIHLYARIEDLDLSVRKPQWDIYEKALRVWDLRKEKKSWSKIANEVFPGDKSLGSAMRKVRHYYDVAEEMILKGGWERI